MRSSKPHPTLPADNPASLAGGWILVAAIALVPLFWLPCFKNGLGNGFVAPRQALVLAVMGPVAAFLLARNWAQRTFARIPVLLVLAIAAAGLIALARAGFDLHTAWRSIRVLGPLLVLVLAGSALMNPRFMTQLHFALVLPAIPVLAIGILRRTTGWLSELPDRDDLGLWSITSTLGNSNEVGEAFAPVVMAGLVFASDTESRVHRILLWLGTACALALVVLSHSRGAQLSTAAGLLVQGVLWIRARRYESDVVARVVAGALALIIVAGVFLWLPVGKSARDYLASFTSTTYKTNVVRIESWKGTLELARESKFLGAGLGRFQATFLPHRSAAEWAESGADTRVDSPHQEFLWILSEDGVAGLAAFLLLLGVAIWRATRPDDGITDVMRAPQRALMLATVVLAVLSFFRSPLHHPSGVLVFATLLGSVAPRDVRPGRALADLAVVPLVGALCVLGLLDVREDLRLGAAITALNDVKADVAARRLDDVARIQANLRKAAAGVKEVRSAMLKDFDRSFRAAQAAGELADLKDALSEKVGPAAWADLPDQADVLALLEEVRARCPNHPGATNQLAYLWLKQQAAAHAVQIWKDAIAALPRAPWFRHNLVRFYLDNDDLAEAFRVMEEAVRLGPCPSDEDRIALASLAIGLGRDGATFGRWLAPPPGPETRPMRPYARGTPAENRRAILLWLADHPLDGLALADLAQIDYKLANETGGSEDMRSEANRAYARSRVRFALEETGDELTEVDRMVRLALQKDPALLDARFLQAKYAARAGRAADVEEGLRTMLARGVGIVAMRGWLEKDADLGPWLRDGKLKALGL